MTCITFATPLAVWHRMSCVLVTRRRGVAPRLAELTSGLLGTELPLGIVGWDGTTAGPTDGPRLVVRSRRALRRLLWDPNELGLARAFVAGDLAVDGDLTEGLRRCRGLGRTRPNWAAVRAFVLLGGVGLRPPPPVSEARPVGRLHTRGRDRSVIAHHYDFGNDFYQAILDPTMSYSCAYFTSDDQPLVDAQRAKLDLICGKLELRAGQRLLDVGCGWGALIRHAAEHYGVHATGITLSQRQAAFIRDRVAEQGLTDRVTVRWGDYRELDGEPFDAVASVEMAEHVGAAQYGRYVSILHRMVRPDGRLLLQQMSRGAVAPGGGAFIESYIAPDMTMVPVGTTLDQLERAGFEILGVQALRPHYDRTIRAWSDALDANVDRLRVMVGDEQIRVWRLYLAGVALAFAQRRMGVNQILAVRTAA